MKCVEHSEERRSGEFNTYMAYRMKAQWKMASDLLKDERKEANIDGKQAKVA